MKKIHILRKNEISAYCQKCNKFLKIACGNMVYCNCGIFEREYINNPFNNYPFNIESRKFNY